MKRLLLTTLIFVLFLAAAQSAHAQAGGSEQTPPPPRPMSVVAPKIQPAVDQGRLENGIYSSDFFGFSFSVKEGWVALDAATRNRVAAVGRAEIQAGVTEKKKAEMDAGMARTSFLISVSKYDVTVPSAEFNAMFMCMAERVPTAVMKTGAEYVAASLRGLNETAAKAELVGRMRAETLGGAPFTVADVKLTVGQKIVAQRYYVRLVKGYALVFVYSYVDEEDLQTLDGMIKTIRFK